MKNQNKPFIQIDDIIREMTDDEYDSYKQQLALTELEKQKSQEVIDNRDSAIAKLTKLGLTQAEIEALKS